MIRVIWPFSRTFGATRSPKWREVRKAHLEKNPACAVCGVIGQIISNEVHHIIPVHIDKRLELEESNLLTMCRAHHLLIGHLLSWYSHNKDVVADSLALHKKILERP